MSVRRRWCVCVKAYDVWGVEESRASLSCQARLLTFGRGFKGCRVCVCVCEQHCKVRRMLCCLAASSLGGTFRSCVTGTPGWEPFAIPTYRLSLEQIMVTPPLGETRAGRCELRRAFTKNTVFVCFLKHEDVSEDIHFLKNILLIALREEGRGRETQKHQ